MKLTFAILALLFTFVASAQVPQRDLQCEEDVFKTAKSEIEEIANAMDKVYRQTSALGRFRGGQISIYNSLTKTNFYDVKVIYNKTNDGKTREYIATMTVDDTCKKILEGTFQQTPLEAIP